MNTSGANANHYSFCPRAHNPLVGIYRLQVHGGLAAVDIAADLVATVAFKMQEEFYARLVGAWNGNWDLSTLVYSDSPLSMQSLGLSCKPLDSETDLLAAVYWLRLLRETLRAMIAVLKPFWAEQCERGEGDNNHRDHLLALPLGGLDPLREAWEVLPSEENPTQEDFRQALLKVYNRHQPFWSGPSNSSMALIYGITNINLRGCVGLSTNYLRSCLPNHMMNSVRSLIDDCLRNARDVIARQHPSLASTLQQVDLDSFFFNQWTAAVVSKQDFHVQPLLFEYMALVLIKACLLESEYTAGSLSENSYRLRAICLASVEFREVFQKIGRIIVLEMCTSHPENSQLYIFELGGAIAALTNRITAEPL